MLCDTTDGLFQSGPAHKSMFNGMFFSFHDYPLCLLSSGCLMSAELQCAPVRHNLWQAICCVPWELQFLENYLFYFSCVCCTLDTGVSLAALLQLFWKMKIKYLFCHLFCFQISWRITTPFLDYRKSALSPSLRRGCFSWSVGGTCFFFSRTGLQRAVTSFVWYNKKKWMHSN